MVMQDEITIDGTDVTDYRITWDFDGEWDISIDSLNVTLGVSVNTLLTITNGMTVVVKRGFTTATDEYVFEGQITQIKPETSIIKLVCKSILYDAIKSGQTKSWDKDIDTEAGVGSEIFKSICDNSGLTYSPALTVLTDGSIVNTGATDITLIRKFIQNDDDDFVKMNELAEYYGYMISYDYDNSLTIFKPRGYSIYPVDLNVGTEIPAQIKWKENMEQMINKVKILGATVYDKVPESFVGPGTSFTLSKTPEATEVYINSTTTNDIQTRGQKAVGTLGTDFDYYVDAEAKTITFSGAVSNVAITYGAQVPMPITVTNQTSIDTYGGPNAKPHFKRMSFNDIKDVNDAELRGRAIINKYSTPFNEAKNIPVIDSIIETNGNLVPGNIVTIKDTFNVKDLEVFVHSVKKSWPHVYDRITVGDEIWRTEDWQANQMKKIEQILNTLNKNEDILIQITDLAHSNTYERRYAKAIYRDTTEDGIWGRGFGNGSIGTLNWNEGAAVWQAAYTNAETETFIIQGKNIYKELMYDTDFKDGTSTATWDTGNQRIDFTAAQVALTSAIALGTTYSFFTLSLGALTGSVLIEFSGDGKVTWQTVTKDVRAAIGTSDATGVHIRFTENAATTARIENTYTTGGDYNLPAIKCILEV